MSSPFQLNVAAAAIADESAVAWTTAMTRRDRDGTIGHLTRQRTGTITSSPPRIKREAGAGPSQSVERPRLAATARAVSYSLAVIRTTPVWKSALASLAVRSATARYSS